MNRATLGHVLLFFFVLLPTTLAGCGSAGSGSGSTASVTAVSASVQGNFTNGTMVVFGATSLTEVWRAPMSTGNTFQVAIAPGHYRLMFIMNEGTDNQGIYYCCTDITGAGAPLTVFLVDQAGSFSRSNDTQLLIPSGGGGGPMLSPALFPLPAGGLFGGGSTPPTLSGTWSFSRTVTSSSCPDNPVGHQDTAQASVAANLVATADSNTDWAGTITVTAASGEILKGSAESGLVYISEFQSAQNASTYELITIGADNKSMSGTFQINETTAKCSAQGTLIATKQ